MTEPIPERLRAAPGDGYEIQEVTLRDIPAPAA